MDSHGYPILLSFNEDVNVDDKVWTKIFETLLTKSCEHRYGITLDEI